MATEGEERANETAQEISQEILTGKPAHSEENETNGNSAMNEGAETGESHSENVETPEERAAEDK